MDTRLNNGLDADQHRALENVRAAVRRIWARPLHRHFTDHTVAHSERIITLLDGLAAGIMTTDKRLTSSEIFILLAAAYLHDVGMQNEKFAGGNLEQIRARHNEQTAEMIYAVFEDPANAFRIPLTDDPGVVEAVALVAKGHRRVDLDGAEYAPFVHSGETVRVRLLAALLRFGDELDIDHRRVDLEQMKLMDLKTDSRLHWWKCHYVGGVSIVDEYIRVSYRFPHSRPDYEDLIVPLVEDGIRAKHADLEPIFRAHAVKVALGRPQVRRMRLVQPLPPEVEALARKWLGGAKSPPQAARPSAGANSTGAPPAPSTDWNTAAIRNLLSAAFSDGKLTTLCFDHFRPVYEDFASGMSKGDKVQRLLDYCLRHDRMDQLLAQVRQRNPAQYARFAPQLRR